MVLNQRDIEQAIGEISDSLESLTEEYADICAEAADAEATYRVRYFKSLLAMKDRTRTPPGSRGMTDKEADARATCMVENELRAYKLTAGKQESTKQALLTLRTRLDAYRTLSANVRAQT